MPTPHVIDLTGEIEILSYALECVAQTESCDYTEPVVSLLASKIRQCAREVQATFRAQHVPTCQESRKREREAVYSGVVFNGRQLGSRAAKES